VAAAALWAAGFFPPVAAAATPWDGSYFPNVALVTQDGQTVRFFDDLLKDKVVAINFVFTSCSASCSMETARLREVQRLLGERMGRDVFFYSISIDPLNDTPAELKRYAEKFNVGPGWLFLTGGERDITLLRQKLGLYSPSGEERLENHSLSLIIGNQATGIWKKASPFENPYFLANQLGAWLHNWKQAGAKRNDYADAPLRLRRMSRGEELFRSRCASCHTIGIDPGPVARRVGPDLGGVTRRRERAWLERWLKEPDVMLAEADPLAAALFARYNAVAMPNLRLDSAEIAALLGYLDDESAEARTVPNMASRAR
jgi:cytochrome oxidase Cu insertion factor (SCO1/SenC/PrrC family)